MRSTVQNLLSVTTIGIGLFVLWERQVPSVPQPVIASPSTTSELPAIMQRQRADSSANTAQIGEVRDQLAILQEQLTSLAAAHTAVVEELEELADVTANSTSAAAVAATEPLSVEAIAAQNTEDRARLESSVSYEMSARNADPILAGNITAGLQTLVYEKVDAEIAVTDVYCVETLCTVQLDHAAGHVPNASELMRALSLRQDVEAYFHVQPVAGGREHTQIFLATGPGGLPDDLEF